MPIQNFQKTSAVFVALAALAWLPSPARAQVTLTLSPSAVTGAPGDTDVAIYGSLTNLSSAPVNTDINFNITGGPLKPDGTPADLTLFYPSADNQLPPTLGAKQVLPVAPLFLLDIDPMATLGTYTGKLIVNYNGQAVDQTFTLNVANPAAVPEAGTLPILALGVGYIFFAARRRRAAPQR